MDPLKIYTQYVLELPSWPWLLWVLELPIWLLLIIGLLLLPWLVLLGLVLTAFLVVAPWVLMREWGGNFLAWMDAHRPLGR